ncbi:E3 ubiquitin-protein ligase sspH2 [compost metagenome]
MNNFESHKPLDMKLLLLPFLLLMSFQLKAQTWIAVPDANFQAYLTAHYPAGAFTTSGGNFFIDSEHPDIQAEGSLDLLGLNISSIEGVQAFENLLNLNCGNNLLTSLPSLPNSLINLQCYKNQLTELPVLPASLNQLSCFENEILTLPDLPSTLVSLQCAGNQLTELPELPGNLNNLFCYGNQLTELPLLPGVLTQLDCSDNPLLSIDSVPNSLTALVCGNNGLTSLPELPDFLVYLRCHSNQITSLPELPPSLFLLECGYNQLTTLPELPNSLRYLRFHENLITDLLSLPDSLTELDCSDNQLTVLPNLPESLVSLRCDENQITALPSLPDTLQILSCEYNQITCFPEFGTAIQIIQIQNNPFTCLPNYTPSMGALNYYPLCDANDPVNNPNGCVSATGILGKMFYDLTNGCATTSHILSNIPVSMYDLNTGTIQSSTSFENGNYFFTIGQGAYELTIDTANMSDGLEVTCPAGNSSQVVLAADTVVSGGDFGLVCSGFDLGVQSVIPSGWVFPGETHQLLILAGDLTAQYNMYCASGISGEVSIVVTGPGTVNFAGSPTSISGNSAIYSIADFGALNANEFLATVLTDTTALGGDSFCVSVSVSTVDSTELSNTNNTYTYCYHVVNSYDPNIKETYPEIVEPGYQDDFAYTIHFQNTGNAPAFNIRLADTLDANLDLSTFKVVNASAEFSVTLNQHTRLLTVRFPNIMLPDSTSNPEGSIGFIQYRVKPVSGLGEGTVIRNTAYIYFDFNAPIVTNTSENLFSETAGLNEFVDEVIQLYPNPSENEVFVRSENSVIEQVTLYDLKGKLVKLAVPKGKQAAIDISDLKSGIYIATVQTNQSSVTKRLIVR